MQTDAHGGNQASQNKTKMNASKSTAEITSEAVRLDAETLKAGSRVTELRGALAKTRTGSKKNAAISEELADAKAAHVALSRQRDSAWAAANSRR